MDSLFKMTSRWTALLVCGFLASCATPQPDREVRELLNQGRVEEAVNRLREAAEKNPRDAAAKMAYERQREMALAQLTFAGESLRDTRHYDEARGMFQAALRLDPQYPRARDALAQLETIERLDAAVEEARRLFEAGDLAEAERRLRAIVAQSPQYGAARRLLGQVRQKQNANAFEPKVLKTALDKPISLDLRDTPMRNVFDALSATAGLNFLFDRDVKTDAKITIFFRNSSIDNALRLILATNALERKILNDNTVLIYPKSKTREYQELVLRTFYLVNADTKQVAALLKSMGRIKEINTDEKLNVVTIRDTPEAVQLAERLVDSIDVAESEVMLEVVVLEIGRTRSRNLGLQYPTQVTRGLPGVETVPTSKVGQTITSLTNPLLVANLFVEDQDSKLLGNPRIRVKNHEKAKVLIGEKLPVITTTAVPSVGQSTAVSYVDIGLKLEVEAQIFLDDEVGIKVALEVNSNLGAVTQNGVTAYDVGTRTANTVLRLHDGETQVLAGLVNDNDEATIQRVPILGDIPGLGRLFSNDNGSHEKSEIVLLITPRIIRNLMLPDTDTLVLAAGTDSEVGARPLSIAPAPPAAKTGQTTAGQTTAAQPAPGQTTAGQPIPGQPGGEHPAIALPPLFATLTVPDSAQPQGACDVMVEVSGTGSATGGEVLLSFDVAEFAASTPTPGVLRVPLGPSGDGGLSGAASFLVVGKAGTSAELRVTAGHVTMPDGSRRDVDAGGTAAIVRIGFE